MTEDRWEAVDVPVRRVWVKVRTSARRNAERLEAYRSYPEGALRKRVADALERWLRRRAARDLDAVVVGAYELRAAEVGHERPLRYDLDLELTLLGSAVEAKHLRPDDPSFVLAEHRNSVRIARRIDKSTPQA